MMLQDLLRHDFILNEAITELKDMINFKTVIGIVID